MSFNREGGKRDDYYVRFPESVDTVLHNGVYKCKMLRHCISTRAIQWNLFLNKGHLGTQAAVPYSEVVPYWEVRDKTVILCTFTASMMYKIHYGVIIMIQSA